MRSVLIVWVASGCAFITDKEYDARLDVSEPDAPACVELLPFWADADGDGFGNPDVEFQDCAPSDGMVDNADDCDDTDASEYPGATWSVDADGDGYGDAANVVESCEAVEGLTGDTSDCDDDDPVINPGVAEDCGTDVDDDCSGETNQADAIGCTEVYADADGDGFGGSESGCFCEPTDDFPATEVADCDDADGAVNPDAEEVCNDGVDNDCDGGATGCGLSTDLDPTRADFRLAGADASSALGATLFRGDDVDGDDEIDLLIGAHEAGAVVRLSGPVLDPGSVTTWTGPAGDWYGRAMASGDLDGDGQVDLVVGAPRTSHPARAQAGSVMVHYGPVALDALLDEGDAEIMGPVGNAYLGRSLMMASDVNADGSADLLIGAIDAKLGGARVGMVAVVSGAPVDGLVDTAVDGSADVRVFGDAEGDKFGVSMAVLADFNGDGMPDPVFGARAAGLNTGMVYGFASGETFSGDFVASDADAVLTGVGSGARTGEAMASPGDINGDGLDDLLVGAPRRNLSGDRRGAAYLITDFATANIDVAAHLELRGTTEQGHFGSALSGIGDLDGSGPGIAVGAPNADAGAVYLFPGGLSGTVNSDDAMGVVEGLEVGDRLGSAVLGDFDHNDDGLLDLAVGAEAADGGAGEALIFFGGGL